MVHEKKLPHNHTKRHMFTALCAHRCWSHKCRVETCLLDNTAHTTFSGRPKMETVFIQGWAHTRWGVGGNKRQLGADTFPQHCALSK